MRTTQQLVLFQVNMSASGQPAGDTEVRMKYDYERAEPLSRETRQPPELWHQHMRDFWDDFPWVSCTTDKDGKGRIAIQYTVLDRTVGSRPPPWRDEVTGKPYLLGISRDGEHDDLSVMMQRGCFVRGTLFEVRILDIEQPKYVD
jgi:hypothetical protein